MTDPYLFVLALGTAGLGVMALGGLGVRAGHQHGSSAARGGHAHAHSHAHAGHQGHASAVAGRTKVAGGRFASRMGAARGRGAAGALGRLLAPLLSPRVAFSILVGVGATGMVARHLLGGWPLLGTALLGGMAFETLLVSPLWNMTFRFASQPAMTLETTLYDQGEAVTGFNAEGQGLISLDVDGQVVQLLGILCPDDRAAGVRVRAGDRVRVEEVDPARNRCLVSRVGS